MSLGLRSLVCLLFCSTLVAQSNNPVPFVNNPLVPASVVPGGRGFTLTINGAGFVPGSVVNWNGSARATVVLSTGSLQATIPASDVAQETTGWVTVVNPSPGGGTSNVASLFVRKPSPSVAMDADAIFQVVPSAVADFNNDGKLDITVASIPKPGQLEIDMYPGKGNGKFAVPVKTKFSRVLASVGSILTADFNGDGKLDLAVNNGMGSNCKFEIFLGNGHGKFFAKGNFFSVCEAWAVADFNGDGKLDLLTQGRIRGGCVATLFLGNGDGTFKFGDRIQSDFCGVGLAIGDFNADDSIDFAVLGVQVYLNNGDGTFQPAVSYPVPYPASGVTAADVNGDGILDLVSTGFSVLLGNGDGTFRNGASVQINSFGPIVAGDFNGDGKVDVVFSSDDSRVELILLGNGDGTFLTPIATRGYSAGETADFFRKGRLGLAVSGQSGNPSVVFRQTDLNLLPSAMQFGNVKVGTSTPPQTATLTNVASTSVTINQIQLNGADPQDYSQTNNCPKSLPVSGSCQINVTFTPTTSGSRTASISVGYRGRGSPETIPLAGDGVAAGTVSLTPSSMTFPVQLLNTVSKAQTATLTNTGAVDVLISSISTAAPFNQTNNCPSDLTVNASCQIKVTFKPQTNKPVNGTLSVNDDAQGSPQTVSLNGTGTAVKISPIGINFGNQAVGTTSNPVPVTLSNVGTVTLNIRQITIKGSNPGDFAQTNDCGTSVPGHGQCTIQVTFTPTQKAQRVATLDIYDDDGGSPQEVALSGTGT